MRAEDAGRKRLLIPLGACDWPRVVRLVLPKSLDAVKRMEAEAWKASGSFEGPVTKNALPADAIWGGARRSWSAPRSHLLAHLR